MGVKLFRDGKKSAIQTNCKNVEEFTEEFSVMLSKLIEEGVYDGGWEQQLRAWLPSMLDICNAMNGYKNQVQKEVVYSSGSKILGKEAVHTYDVENAQEVKPQSANGFREHQPAASAG